MGRPKHFVLKTTVQYNFEEAASYSGGNKAHIFTFTSSESMLLVVHQTSRKINCGALSCSSF